VLPWVGRVLIVIGILYIIGMIDWWLCPVCRKGRVDGRSLHLFSSSVTNPDVCAVCRQQWYRHDPW
jgi:hypothetical protein